MSGSDDEAGDSGRIAKLRRFYARYVAARGAAKDQRIEGAFATIPREPFAGPGPWSILPVSPWHRGSDLPRYVETCGNDPAFLYQDVLLALDPARGINIGEPSLHAHCLDALALSPGETVLQVGAGSGYYSAILADLVGSTGCVHAFEIDPDLAVRAVQNLVPWPWTIVHSESGVADGLPSADAIYVNAGITQPSWEWLQTLRPNGRLLFPLQEPGGFGGMLLIRKPIEGGLIWPARFVCRAGFVACQGRQDETLGRALSRAFASGTWTKVRTLHLDGTADDTCWLDGGDWWLSTGSALGARGKIGSRLE